MRKISTLIGLATISFAAGCVNPFATLGPNAFLTLAEEFGAESSPTAITEPTDTTGGSAGSGTSADAFFRQEMSLTLQNNDTTADLNVSLAAWILPSSLISTAQEDLLINAGFVPTTRLTAIGTLEIPVGAFVRNGGGFAGTENLSIAPMQAEQFTIVTPDVLLIYNDLPRSCESVAFEYQIGGEPVPSRLIVPGDSIGGETNNSSLGATNSGGRKTLAQIDAYQCTPFMPGLYFRPGGGARSNNEFFEGQGVRVDFNLNVQDNGQAAFVTFE